MGLPHWGLNLSSIFVSVINVHFLIASTCTYIITIFLIGEWTTPVYKYVDPFAKSKCTSTVEQLMRTPKPPEGGYQPAPPPEIRGTRPMSADMKEAARREYRFDFCYCLFFQISFCLISVVVIFLHLASSITYYSNALH